MPFQGNATGHDALSLPAPPGLWLCWLLPSGSWRPRLPACVVPSTPIMEQGHVSQGYEMIAPGPCGGWGSGQGSESHVMGSRDVARTSCLACSPSALKACTRAEKGATGLSLWIKDQAGHLVSIVGRDPGKQRLKSGNLQQPGQRGRSLRC